jgi:glutaminyl-peptide cyclotransferase
MNTAKMHSHSSKETGTLNSRRLFSIVLLLFPFAFTACPNSNGGNNLNVNQYAQASPATPATSPATENSAQPDSSSRLTIDADKAFQSVKTQVDFGPRPAGSAELARTRDYLVNALKSYGLKVSLDEFTASTPQGDKRMANIVAELPGASPDIIIISSHYDTKPFTSFKFVGANDGASSTAVLLEIARVMAQSNRQPPLTYRFLFFDGEEAFCKEWDECGKPNNPDHTYGSRHYLSVLQNAHEDKRVKALILLDMIGYKDLEMGKDDMSTRWLVNSIWDTAHGLGYTKQFQERPEGVGGDDHEPFLRAGIESVDLIQLGTYEYWHTAEDTLDKISPQSLKIVGDVVLASLPAIEKHILGH